METDAESEWRSENATHAVDRVCRVLETGERMGISGTYKRFVLLRKALSEEMSG